jgi:hypothetical protein
MNSYRIATDIGSSAIDGIIANLCAQISKPLAKKIGMPGYAELCNPLQGCLANYADGIRQHLNAAAR